MSHQTPPPNKSDVWTDRIVTFIFMATVIVGTTLGLLAK